MIDLKAIQRMYLKIELISIFEQVGCPSNKKLLNNTYGIAMEWEHLSLNLYLTFERMRQKR